MALRFQVDGRDVEVPDDGASLLEALRDRLGLRTAKDGCSPQGQCGCCTVLVDGSPRVSCVTPARRVVGREVTTLDGLPAEVRQRWADAFTATGASQCGFCTPGILVRLAGANGLDGGPLDQATTERALLAHLCRCTGWRSIIEAATTLPGPISGRDLDAAARRAAIEGGTPQRVGPEVALGHGGFADDLAPPDALVAVPDGGGGWVVGETLTAARATAGSIPGRRSGTEIRHPVEIPAGEWALTLRTTWVEPGYVETDASWCVPGGEPATPLGNGGAFGGKVASPAPAAARRLADEYGRPVRVVLSREDTVRLGPKRPPLAAGVRPDGTGIIRVVRTPGIAQAIASVAPGLKVEAVDVAGPPTSTSVRAAGWAEAAVLLAAASSLAGPSGGGGSATGPAGSAWPATGPAGSPWPATGPAGSAWPATGPVGSAWPATGPVGSGSPAAGSASIVSPAGATATARVAIDRSGRPTRVDVSVSCGDPLDQVVLRSYAIGAAHMALGWVFREGVAVDDDGVPQDLTIRSFGILRAVDTPPIDVAIEPSDGPAVNGSDAVFAAVAAAAWIAQGCPPDWPTRRNP